MSTGAPTADELPERLLPARPGRLTPAELRPLWELFAAIGDAWSDGSLPPERQRSHWLEFIEVRTLTEPSYVAEYRSALLALEELRQQHGSGMWQELFFGETRTAPLTTRRGHLRRYVVEEFIRVWLTSGGFKEFGAGNYNSFVSGSRYAVNSPYRLAATNGRG
ncbi:MAG: hypothetical protein AB7U73_03310 [Pirellulales bacterium]